MLGEQMAARIRVTGQFFTRTVACLDESHSGFAPEGDLYTVAAHVEHAAGTIDWFMGGMFGPKGFDLEFDRHIAEAKACGSLAEARAHFDRAIDAACSAVASKSDEELMAPLPDNVIFGPVPRAAIIDGLVDHTAHHRGALAVYARLVGKSPDMPYG